jgi:hypothetical protein
MAIWLNNLIYQTLEVTLNRQNSVLVKQMPKQGSGSTAKDRMPILPCSMLDPSLLHV